MHPVAASTSATVFFGGGRRTGLTFVALLLLVACSDRASDLPTLAEPPQPSGLSSSAQEGTASSVNTAEARLIRELTTKEILELFGDPTRRTEDRGTALVHAAFNEDGEAALLCDPHQSIDECDDEGSGPGAPPYVEFYGESTVSVGFTSAWFSSSTNATEVADELFVKGESFVNFSLVMQQEDFVENGTVAAVGWERQLDSFDCAFEQRGTHEATAYPRTGGVIEWDDTTVDDANTC